MLSLPTIGLLPISSAVGGWSILLIGPSPLGRVTQPFWVAPKGRGAVMRGGHKIDGVAGAVPTRGHSCDCAAAPRSPKAAIVLLFFLVWAAVRMVKRGRNAGRIASRSRKRAA